MFPTSDMDSFHFAAAYLRIGIFADWPEPNYKEFKLAKTPTEAMRTFCRLHEAGKIFPSFDNLRKTKAVCDRFLDGRIDWHMLGEIRNGLKRDSDRVAPFDEAVGLQGSQSNSLDARDLQIVKPLGAPEFQAALSLLDFVEKRTDPNSGYCLLAPPQIAIIREMMGSIEGAIKKTLPKPEP